MRNAGDGGKGERTNEMKRRYSPGERMETEKEEREREEIICRYTLPVHPLLLSFQVRLLICLIARHTR